MKQSALAGVGFWVGGTALGAKPSKSPNEKLHVAGIGVGGKGGSDIGHCHDENVIALCDVDERMAEGARKQFPQAKFYRDFREMLEKEKTLDAVTISTPDHMHAPAAAMAMRLGLHVYVQKPLTHTIKEARVLRQLAAEKNLVTRMGNQGTASNALRTAAEVVRGGALGKVTEIPMRGPIGPSGHRARKRYSMCAESKPRRGRATMVTTNTSGNGSTPFGATARRYRASIGPAS